jgi:hypothetical protein
MGRSLLEVLSRNFPAGIEGIREELQSGGSVVVPAESRTECLPNTSTERCNHFPALRKQQSDLLYISFG